MRTHLVYDGDDVADALIRSSHFAVHVYSEGGISVLATRDDGCVTDAVLDDVGGGGRLLTIHGRTGASAQPSAAAAMAELDWRNAVMQVRARATACKPFHSCSPSHPAHPREIRTPPLRQQLQPPWQPLAQPTRVPWQPPALSSRQQGQAAAAAARCSAACRTLLSL